MPLEVKGRVRLLEPIATGWLLGLWAGFVCGQPYNPWGALLGVAVTIAWGTCGRTAPNRRLRVALPCLSFAAGATCGLAPPTPLPPMPAGLARVQAMVEHTYVLPNGNHESELVVLQGRRVRDGKVLSAGSRLRAGPYPMPAGTEVNALLTIRPCVTFRNPSPHPPWPLVQAIHGWATLAAPSAFRTLRAHPLRRPLGRLRAAVRNRLHASLADAHAALACALLLGDRRGLGDDFQDVVGAAGLAHVLAVSGLHVSLTAGLAVALMRRLLLLVSGCGPWIEPHRWACAAGAVFALVFGEGCGAGPSTMRASTTAALAFVVRACGRRPNTTAVAALAVLLQTTVDPLLALQPAFLLSILATAAVLQAGLGDTALRSETSRPYGVLWTSVRISWATTVATAPVVVWCFGRLPLIGLLSNLLGVPLMGLVLLPLTLLHGLLVTLVPTLAGASAILFALAADAFMGLVGAFANLGLDLELPIPNLAQGALISCLAGASLVLRRPRTWTRLAIVAAVLWLLCEWRLRTAEQPRGLLRATFLDVGQGDAAMLDMPNGQLILVDAGGNPAGGRDPGKHVLLPLLRARRRTHIDIAVITHPHPDHYGGLRAVLDTLPVHELWDNGQASAERWITATARAGDKLLDAARARGTKVRTAAELCGPGRHFGRARVQVLWPCPAHDSTLSENDNSLLLLVEFGRVRWLLTGDLEQAAETRLLARGALPRVDILKVGHHGSRTSSSAALLQVLSPVLSVISRGRDNRFGHPHPETLARLRQSGTKVLDLAETGGVVATTDGDTLSVRTWSGQTLKLEAQASAGNRGTMADVTERTTTSGATRSGRE